MDIIRAIEQQQFKLKNLIIFGVDTRLLCGIAFQKFSCVQMKKQVQKKHMKLIGIISLIKK